MRESNRTFFPGSEISCFIRRYLDKVSTKNPVKDNNVIMPEGVNITRIMKEFEAANPEKKFSRGYFFKIWKPFAANVTFQTRVHIAMKLNFHSSLKGMLVLFFFLCVVFIILSEHKIHKMHKVFSFC